MSGPTVAKTFTCVLDSRRQSYTQPASQPHTQSHTLTHMSVLGWLSDSRHKVHIQIAIHNACTSQVIPNQCMYQSGHTKPVYVPVRSYQTSVCTSQVIPNQCMFQSGHTKPVYVPVSAHQTSVCSGQYTPNQCMFSPALSPCGINS